ncbi:MAG: hypothetical protein J5J00_03495 [Deltaproteobacteria bacterium]|nr:hypothetical protein [Deltaproteobacteria bacterium]
MSIPVSGLNISQGRCHVYFAFDLGLSIDLERCDRMLKESAERASFHRKRRSPVYFDYDPAPLRLSQQGRVLRHDLFTAESAIEVTLFEFGAISVHYAFPLSGPFESLVALSDALYDNKTLLADARERAMQLLDEISGAVKRPNPAELMEDYTVFHIEKLQTELPLVELIQSARLTTAQILRSDGSSLSEEEIREAISHHTSYTEDDLVIIDWSAALVIGDKVEDVIEALEFANVDLLEMRYLDEQLDDALKEAYAALSAGTRVRASLRKVAQLQADSAMLFEAVNNALKLTGDQYLARVYSLVTQRLHLLEWDSSIIRKLNTLDSIYHKISDQAGQRRSEFLEWVIILLIAFEILYTLLQH